MIRAACLAVLWATGAGALTLDLPAPARKAETESQIAAVTLPSGAWSSGTVPTVHVEGVTTRTAWQLPGQSRTVQQILAPARNALIEAGYEVAFDCSDRACGGYDFRFALDLLPPPAMYVDLGNYRYVLARGPGEAVVSLVASRTQATGYLHVTEVRPDGAPPPKTVAAASVSAGSVWDMLRTDGRVVLDDLVFATGSSTLAEGPFTSLQALADGLATDPEANITLVGHTDTDGGLEGNLALSRRRAQAVRQALIADHGISGNRISAEGVAYLAPRASNDTEAGRKTNRRVEVVLTPD